MFTSIVENSFSSLSLCWFWTKFELNLFMNSWADWPNHYCSWCMLFPVGDCWRIIWQWWLCWTCIQRAEIGWQGKVFGINLTEGSNKASTQSLIRFSPIAILSLSAYIIKQIRDFREVYKVRLSPNCELVNEIGERLQLNQEIFITLRLHLFPNATAQICMGKYDLTPLVGTF